PLAWPPATAPARDPRGEGAHRSRRWPPRPSVRRTTARRDRTAGHHWRRSPSMSHLTGKTIAFLATDGFEDSELTSPWQAVTEHGATVRLVSTEAGTITGKNGHEATVDLTTAEARAEDFDGLVLPGGVVNGDTIRLDAEAVAFVREIFAQHKPVGVICHGGWILADADVLQGDRKSTRLNSSHVKISYAVFCLKKKKEDNR